MSAVMAASIVAASLPASASASAGPGTSLAALTAAAVVAEPASVLGLEGDDGKANDALTRALRKAFAARGYAGGEEISLAELRLSMGCEGNDPACLAEGGDALGVERIVYGSLTPEGGGYSLSLKILNVADADVERETTVPVEKKDLEPDRIDAAAATIVDSMFPSEGDDELPEATTAVRPGEEGDDAAVDDAPKRESDYEWGAYQPRPRWKKIGLGVSAGLMAVSLAGGIIFGVPALLSTRKKGRLYEDLIKAADASLTDSEAEIAAGSTPGFNDVDRTIVQEICSDAPGSGGAREQLTPDGPNSQSGVRNRDITKQCTKGETYATIGTASWVTFGVATASTILFTTLMFVHKKGKGESALLRRGVQFGAAPTRHGVVVGGGLRF
jgi:hypothetical protein